MQKSAILRRKREADQREGEPENKTGWTLGREGRARSFRPQVDLLRGSDFIRRLMVSQ